jgi:hypothetical protein
MSLKLVAEIKIPRQSVEAQKRAVQSNESSGISKEDLRQVQGHYAQRCSACDLRERKAQAAPGISKTWQAGTFPHQ